MADLILFIVGHGARCDAVAVDYLERCVCGDSPGVEIDVARRAGASIARGDDDDPR